MTFVTLLQAAQRGIQPGQDPAAFMTLQMPGAFRNGTRVVKVAFDEGDFHHVGTTATVIGSLGPVDGEFGYFVHWDDMPGKPVFIRGRKLGRVS